MNVRQHRLYHPAWQADSNSANRSESITTIIIVNHLLLLPLRIVKLRSWSMSFAREKQLASVMTAWPISVRQPSFLTTSTCTVGRIKLAFDYISYDFLPGTLSLNLPDFNSNHRIIDPRQVLLPHFQHPPTRVICFSQVRSYLASLARSAFQAMSLGMFSRREGLWRVPSWAWVQSHALFRADWVRFLLR